MSLESQEKNDISDEIDIADNDPVEVVIDDNSGNDERSFTGESNTRKNTHEGETIEERRARRAAERRNSAERRKAAIQRSSERQAQLERTVEELKSQLSKQTEAYSRLEGMAKNYQMESLDKEINDNKNLIAYFQQQYAEAVSSMDGQASAKALQLMRDAESKVGTLEQQKKQYIQQRQQPQDQQQFIDPRVQLVTEQTNRHRERFLKTNSWFGNPDYAEETEVARAIDNEIFLEGYQSNTPAYWNRLEERLKEELDYMYDDDQSPQKNATQTQKNIVGASASASAPSNSTGQIKLKFSADKVPVLKQLGVMDDNNRIVDKSRAMYYWKSWNKQGEK